jgi:hypothetical protein
MPSVIGDTGYNGLGGPAANYLKAKPSTRFSTRQLAFVEIEVTGCHTNPYLSDSLYSRAIRGVQAVAEVYAVGTPASNKFMVVIAQDTDGADDNNDIDLGSDNSQSMADAVRYSVQGNDDLELTINANYKRLSGDGFASGVATYGDESVAGNNYVD